MNCYGSYSHISICISVYLTGFIFDKRTQAIVQNANDLSEFMDVAAVRFQIKRSSIKLNVNNLYFKCVYEKILKSEKVIFTVVYFIFLANLNFA